MKKARILSLALLLLISSLSFAHPPGSKNIAAANRSWPSFIVAFRAAVNKRDQTALRGMIATPFITQEDKFNSPDEVIKWLDRDKLWGELQREIAPRTKSSSNNAGARPQRSTGIFDFEFARDGRWRLSGQSENEVQ